MRNGLGKFRTSVIYASSGVEFTASTGNRIRANSIRVVNRGSWSASLKNPKDIEFGYQRKESL